MKSLILPVALLILACTSCKKPEDEPVEKEPIQNNKQLTPNQLISQHSWIKTDWAKKHKDSSIWSSTAPCDKDNIITYRADSIFLLDQGDLKCFPSNPDVDSSGQWELKNDSVFITYTISPTQSFTEKNRIELLTKTELILQTEQLINGSLTKFYSFYKPN